MKTLWFTIDCGMACGSAFLMDATLLVDNEPSTLSFELVHIVGWGLGAKFEAGWGTHNKLEITKGDPPLLLELGIPEGKATITLIIVAA